MSRTPKEVVAEYYRTALGGEIEAMKAVLDPGIRVIEAESLPYGGTWEGTERFLQLLQKVFETWKDCRVEVKQLVADGDCVVALTEMSGKGARSGRPFSMSLAEVYRVRDGRIVEIKPFYFDSDELRRVHEAVAS
jgi:ketosteroid isomerase-like protein